MKVKIFLLTVLIAFSSCSVHKKLKREQTETKTETQTSTVENNTTTATRTIIAEGTAPVQIAADSSKLDGIDLNELKSGQVITVESEGSEATLQTDPKTGKTTLKTKSKAKTVQAPTRTTTVENVVSVQNTHAQTKEVKQVNTLKLDKSKDVSYSWLNWLWLLLLLIPAYLWFRER